MRPNGSRGGSGSTTPGTATPPPPYHVAVHYPPNPPTKPPNKSGYKGGPYVDVDGDGFDPYDPFDKEELGHQSTDSNNPWYYPLC